MSILFSNETIGLIIRLFIACICGICIGAERKERSKEAGIRTHCVVACAAALMMLVSKYGFNDIDTYPGIRNSGADPSRIASQIVSGVGFLGAGMIFVHKNTVKGLTTAAGIWATAGIGMAIGSGMYVVGLVTTIIILLVQIIFHINASIFKMPNIKLLIVSEVGSNTFQDDAIAKLKRIGITVKDIEITKNNSIKEYNFMIDIPKNINEESIIELFDYDCRLMAKQGSE